MPVGVEVVECEAVPFALVRVPVDVGEVLRVGVGEAVRVPPTLPPPFPPPPRAVRLCDSVEVAQGVLLGEAVKEGVALLLALGRALVLPLPVEVCVREGLGEAEGEAVPVPPCCC